MSRQILTALSWPSFPSWCFRIPFPGRGMYVILSPCASGDLFFLFRDRWQRLWVRRSRLSDRHSHLWGFVFCLLVHDWRALAQGYVDLESMMVTVLWLIAWDLRAQWSAHWGCVEGASWDEWLMRFRCSLRRVRVWSWHLGCLLLRVWWAALGYLLLWILIMKLFLVSITTKLITIDSNIQTVDDRFGRTTIESLS